MTHLLLIPTDLEWRLLQPTLRQAGEWGGDEGWAWEHGPVRLCGFGLIVSAARTAALIRELQPRGVVLAGIAGSLSDSVSIGGAYEFSRIAVDGLGVGSDCPAEAGGDSNFRTSDQMGWPQWPGSVDSPRIGDRIELRPNDQTAATTMPPAVNPRSDLGLLSVCAAAADRAHADRRRNRYADMSAEDMEGFAVAAACALAGIPLRVIRGISNRAGDRNVGGWQIEAALQSVAQLLNENSCPAAASHSIRPTLEGN